MDDGVASLKENFVGLNFIDEVEKSMTCLRVTRRNCEMEICVMKLTKE